MARSREEYIEKLKQKLEDWNTEISSLEAKAEQVAGGLKEQYHKQLEDAKLRRDELQDTLAELKQSGDAAWDDLKSGADLAWDALTTALKSAKSKFER